MTAVGTGDPHPTEAHARTTPYIAKYAGLALFGFHSSITGVATIGATAGPQWGLVWPSLITVLAVGALVGVLRTRAQRPPRFEIIATLLLLGHLASYSVFIVLRTIEDGQVERLPYAWLPLLVSFFPYARLVKLFRGTRTTTEATGGIQ